MFNQIQHFTLKLINFSGGSDPGSAPRVGHRADAAAAVRGVRPEVAVGVVQVITYKNVIF